MNRHKDLTFLSSPRGLVMLLRRLAFRMRHVPREMCSPSALWLLEHVRFLGDQWAAMRPSFRFASRLPKGEKDARILEAAREICWTQTDVLSGQSIRAGLGRTGGAWEWTLQEMSFLPLSLRIALMEKVGESVHACLKESSSYHAAMRWTAAAQKGTLPPVPDDKLLLEKIIRLLTDGERADVLKKLDAALRKKGLTAESVTRAAQEHMTAAQQRLSRAILSLQRLERVDFFAVNEDVSPVFQALHENAGFARMDRDSRGYYAARARHIGKEYCVPEAAAARAAVALAAGKTGPEGDAGYYLIEHPESIAQYLMVTKKTGFIRRHREGVYLCALYVPALAAAAGTVALGAPLWAATGIWLCAGECARQIAYSLLRRLFPPRLAPRIRVRDIDVQHRTLVVVPTLITSRSHMLRMARHLSVLQCAAGGENIDFMLLMDFADGDAATQPRDDDILLAADTALRALNEQTQGAPFYGILRGRVWQEGQKKYMGWERKRGALNMLNDLITAGHTDDKVRWANMDVSTLQGRYAYVVTLDADTFLPPGTVQKLVGAMLHPLQKGRVAVIQPRMAVGADTVRTRAQWYLGGRGGLDVYGGAAQDVYQDVFGRGSFVGKGIYDPFLWCRRLAGKLPNGRLLSHDLIEGEYAGSMLAENIALYDGNPARLDGFIKRLHRWTRGDWQLLPFLLLRDLSLLSRHKIWDNLRRSVLPLGQAALLLTAAHGVAPWLALFALPWPIRGMGLRLTLMPALAYTQLDGAVRALWRQFVSRKNLLSWVTADQAEGQLSQPVPGMLFSIACGLSCILLALQPGGFLPLAVVGAAWVFSPLIGLWLDREYKPEPRMEEEDGQEALRLAQETWHFFDAYVGENTHFLPPDNVQLSPDKGAAMRTSPTNIGLYLLSCLSACELGIIPGRELGRRLHDTLCTLEKLEKWQGNLYNWYDLKDLSVLADGFVSSVDAGNLAACLLCAAQGARAHLKEFAPQHRSVPAQLDKLFDDMRLSAFYDKREKLFWIGANGRTGEHSPSHYDMLGSEARLLSFAAIVKKDVPPSHFFRLGRAVVRGGGGAALLSWGGTMFEYLLPQILLPMYPGTLLREGCLRAVRAQMADHPERPWGVSESGYAAFDPDMNYQYRAFGLPKLAKSGDAENSVVAPYASVMAMPYFPSAVCDNVRRMRALGWHSEYGLYEAVDYTPARVEKTPRLVQSHMAHHQGMILCSICNALRGRVLHRYFVRIPRVQAMLYLLTEPAPRHAPMRRLTHVPAPSVPMDVYMERVPRPPYPVDAAVMGFHGTTYVVSASGHGKLYCGKTLLTRFAPESGAQTGPQTYVRAVDGDQVFRPSEGSARFETGSVVFTHARDGLEVEERRAVLPLTGAFAVLVTLRNPGKSARDADVCSYLEVALGDEGADAAHPNFRDLSVSIAQADDRVLIARRRKGHPGDENVPLLAHLALGNGAQLIAQGDRRLFLGKGTVERPDFMQEDTPACRVGDVIAPCVSFRMRLAVPARGEISCAFITASGPHEKALREMLDKYPTLNRVREDMALSRAAAQLQARGLHVNAARQEMYQRLLGAAFFTLQPHQTAMPAAPMDALYRHGLSGEYPVVTLVMQEGCDPMLLRHLLRAHEWLRLQGVWMDVCIVCRKETDYHRPVLDQVNRIIASTGARAWLGSPGGVHVLPLLPGEEEGLCCLSRLVLRGGTPLRSQLDALHQATGAQIGAALQTGEGVMQPLLDANGFGGFTEEGHYHIASRPHTPWHHILCNEQVGTLVCDRGILHTWYQNSRQNRITPASRDVYSPSPSEEVFVMLPEGMYSLIQGSVTYEPGVAVYRVHSGPVAAEMEVFVCPDRPISIRRITLRSTEEIRVRLCWRVRFAMGEKMEYTRMTVQDSCVLARSGAAWGTAYAAADGENAVIRLEDGGAALIMQPLLLHAREGESVAFVLGCAEKESDIPAALPPAGEMLHAVRTMWQERLQRITVYTMDAKIDRMANVWLPYQVLASRLMARMGPYQASGAIGFRDQLQDVLAFLYTDPDRVRQHILLCAGHQYLEGDVQHWWHGARHGVRTRITDDRLFLPYAAARYANVTGDEAIFAEKAPYLCSAPLAKGEKDRYEIPDVSVDEGTLLDHCLQAVDSVQLGEHGLCLMGGGDWNDGMNGVGGERGESVWLSFFLVIVLRRLAVYCDERRKEELLQKAKEVMQNTQAAWTGKWYLRAWYDDGTPLGGPDTQPPRIDLITQCFAVLAGVPVRQGRKAMEHAWEQLYDGELGMVKLLWPPFAEEEKAGYITAYVDGVRENGGQYTHAVPWMVEALCALGEGERAWEVFRAVLPVNHSDTREKAVVYQAEPYVMAGDVYAGQNAGRAGWTWYTGSAGWMYQTLLYTLLGFEKRGGKVRLCPQKGLGEKEVTLVYRYGRAVYHLTAAKGTAYITLDGKRQEEDWITLSPEKGTHEARFPMWTD